MADTMEQDVDTGRLQELYHRVSDLGGFKEPGSRIQQIGHRLRELGAIQDATQGGLVDPTPVQQAPVAPPAPPPSFAPTSAPQLATSPPILPPVAPNPMAPPPMQPAPTRQRVSVPPGQMRPQRAPYQAQAIPAVTPVQFKGIEEEDILRIKNTALDRLPAIFHNPKYHVAANGPIAHMKMEQTQATVGLGHKLPGLWQEWEASAHQLAAQGTALDQTKVRLDQARKAGFGSQADANVYNQQAADYNRQVHARQASAAVLKRRLDHLNAYQASVNGVVKRYQHEPFHTGLLYPQEADQGGSGDTPGTNTVVNFVRNLANLKIAGVPINPLSRPEDMAQQYRANAAILQLSGQWQPLPALSKEPKVAAQQIREKNALAARLSQFVKAEVPVKHGHAYATNSDLLTPEGEAMGPERLELNTPAAQAYLATLTPWQRQLLPSVSQGILMARQARAPVGRGLVASIGAFDVAHIFGMAAAGSPRMAALERLITKYVSAPAAGALLKARVNPLLTRAAVNALPRAASGFVGGGVAGGAATGTAALLQGASPKEAAREALATVPAMGGVGAAAAVFHGGMTGRPHGAVHETPGMSKRLAVKPAIAPDMITLPDGSKLDLNQASRGTLETLANTLPDTHAARPKVEARLWGPTDAAKIATVTGELRPARALTGSEAQGILDDYTAAEQTNGLTPAQQQNRAAVQQHLALHEAHEQLRQLPPRPEAINEQTKTWKQEKTLGQNHSRLLETTAAGLDTARPEVASALREAAQALKHDFDHEFRQADNVESGLQTERDPSLPSPERSAWRKLSPDDRARLPENVRRVLLLQDIRNSGQVVEPTVPGRQFTNGFEKRATHWLEAEADRRWYRAEQQFGQGRPAPVQEAAAPGGITAKEVIPAPPVGSPPGAASETPGMTPMANPEAGSPAAAVPPPGPERISPVPLPSLEAPVAAPGPTGTRPMTVEASGRGVANVAVPQKFGGGAVSTGPFEPVAVSPPQPLPRNVSLEGDTEKAVRWFYDRGGKGSAFDLSRKLGIDVSEARDLIEHLRSQKVLTDLQDDGQYHTIAPRDRAETVARVAGDRQAAEQVAVEARQRTFAAQEENRPPSRQQRRAEARKQGGTKEATLIVKPKGEAPKPKAVTIKPKLPVETPPVETPTATETSAEKRAQARNISKQGFRSDEEVVKDAAYTEYRRKLAENGGQADAKAHAAVQDVINERLKAHVDPKTGLLNNVSLERTLDRAAAHVKATGEDAHYFEMDIKNLGGMNDAIEPERANAVMKVLAKLADAKLRQQLGGHLSFYRAGGDEFGGVLVGGKGGAEALGRALAEIQDDFKRYSDKRTFTVNGKEVSLKDIPNPKAGKEGEYGTGIEVAHTDIRAGDSPEAAQGRASAAVTAAKKARAAAAAPRSEPAPVDKEARLAAIGEKRGALHDEMRKVAHAKMAGNPEAVAAHKALFEQDLALIRESAKIRNPSGEVKATPEDLAASKKTRQGEEAKRTDERLADPHLGLEAKHAAHVAPDLMERVRTKLRELDQVGRQVSGEPLGGHHDYDAPAHSALQNQRTELSAGLQAYAMRQQAVDKGHASADPEMLTYWRERLETALNRDYGAFTKKPENKLEALAMQPKKAWTRFTKPPSPAEAKALEVAADQNLVQGRVAADGTPEWRRTGNLFESLHPELLEQPRHMGVTAKQLEKTQAKTAKIAKTKVDLTQVNAAQASLDEVKRQFREEPKSLGASQSSRQKRLNEAEKALYLAKRAAGIKAPDLNRLSRAAEEATAAHTLAEKTYRDTHQQLHDQWRATGTPPPGMDKTTQTLATKALESDTARKAALTALRDAQGEHMIANRVEGEREAARLKRAGKKGGEVDGRPVIQPAGTPGDEMSDFQAWGTNFPHGWEQTTARTPAVSPTGEAGVKGGQVGPNRKMVDKLAGTPEFAAQYTENYGNPAQVADDLHDATLDRFAAIRKSVSGLMEGFQRVYKDLERGAENAELELKMLRRQDGTVIANAFVHREIRRALRGLSPDERQVLELDRYVGDMLADVTKQRDRWTAEGGDPKRFKPLLPGGLDEISARATKQNIDDYLQNHAKGDGVDVAKIQAAHQKIVDYRTRAIDKFQDLYFKVNGTKLALDPDTYFRHQILYLDAAQAAMGAGAPRVQARPGRGHLKARLGSQMGYNTSFIESELNWLPEMVKDTLDLEILHHVHENYDVARIAKLAKVETNDPGMIAAIEAHLAGRALDTVRLDTLARLAAENHLPDQINNAHREVLKSLAQMHDRNLRAQALGQARVGLSPEAQLALRDYLTFLRKDDGKGKVTLRSIMEDKNWQRRNGLAEYQAIEGRHFYRVMTIPERVMRDSQAATLAQIVGDGGLREVLAAGAQRRTMIVPVEIKNLLENYTGTRTDLHENALQAAMMWGQKVWKWDKLYNPVHSGIYWIGNALSDLDAITRGNPRALLHLKRAGTELFNVSVRGHDPTPEMAGWIDRGGLAANFVQREGLGTQTGINLLKEYATREQPRWKRWTTSARQTAHALMIVPHELREGTGRYAAYLAYLDDLKKNNGFPSNYGASDNRQVDAIAGLEDKAWKLSNELLGAYDQVSHNGQFLRKYVFPFWSWQEVSLGRETRFLKNALYAPEIAAANGRQMSAGKAVGVRALALGRYLAGAAMVGGATELANQYHFGADYRKKLPKEMRDRFAPVLVLREDPKSGQLLYMDRPGNLVDVSNWLNLNNGYGYVRDWMNRKMTVKEIADDFVHQGLPEAFTKGALGRMLQQAGAQFKVPYEFALGMTTFPDPTKPHKVDHWEALFREVSLDKAYKMLRGLPMPPPVTVKVGGKEIGGRVPAWAAAAAALPTLGFGATLYGNDMLHLANINRLDLHESDYFDVKGDAAEWQRKKTGGTGFGGTASNSMQTAAYYFRLSLRYHDIDSAERFLWDYGRAGGSDARLHQSLTDLDPLHALKKSEQARYLDQLDLEGQERLRRAYTHWGELVAPDVDLAPYQGEKLSDFILSARTAVNTSLKVQFGSSSTAKMGMFMDQGKSLDPVIAKIQAMPDDKRALYLRALPEAGQQQVRERYLTLAERAAPGLKLKVDPNLPLDQWVQLVQSAIAGARQQVWLDAKQEAAYRGKE